MRLFQLFLVTILKSVLAFRVVSPPAVYRENGQNLGRWPGPELGPWTRCFPIYHTATPLASSSSDKFERAPSSDASKAESILEELHQSGLQFRIVVVGNGAILETTSKLGPKTSSSVSPKTGDKLLTFASEDASFEFHVKVEQVCMITFTSVERPSPITGENKTMRVSRFLSENGTSMCSLILAESSAKAAEWFEGMLERYGQEIMM